jgi:hypothetical protein
VDAQVTFCQSINDGDTLWVKLMREAIEYGSAAHFDGFFKGSFDATEVV